MMRAVCYTKEGQLSIQSVPTPELRDGYVLLKVVTSAVNRADILQVTADVTFNVSSIDGVTRSVWFCLLMTLLVLLLCRKKVCIRLLRELQKS